MNKTELEQYERSILKELIQVTGNKKLQIKDIVEWNASELEETEDQEVIFLPQLKLYVALGGESKVSSTQKIEKDLEVSKKAEEKFQFPNEAPATTAQEKIPPVQVTATLLPPVTAPPVAAGSRAPDESKILDELIVVTRDAKLTKKNLIMWGFGRVSAGIIGEELFYLPDLQIHALIKR